MSLRRPRWPNDAAARSQVPFAALSFDPTALRTIPLIEVIRLMTEGYQRLDAFCDADDIDATLEHIAELAPELQTFAWLAILEGGLADEINYFGPSPLTYGGPENFYASIQCALVEAGLARRSAAFASAVTSKAANRTPTLFPPRLRSLRLGDDFGTKTAFASAVEDYVRLQPTAMECCREGRAELGDDERLRALLNALWRLDPSHTYRDWPEPYRVLLLADILDAEIDKGAFHLFFSSPSGDLAPEIADALHVLGLPRHAEAVGRGMACFAKPYPKTHEERVKAFPEDCSSDWANQLQDNTWLADFDALRPAMITYAQGLTLLPR